MSPEGALLAAGALHVGFQATVTLLVYPALLALPASGWAAGQSEHSRRIVPLVGLVYLAVLAACTTSLLDDPRAVSVVVAVGGHALALGTTALVAAPAHGRLAREGPTTALVRRLVRADRVRLLGAVVALVAAGIGWAGT